MESEKSSLRTVPRTPTEAKKVAFVKPNLNRQTSRISTATARSYNSYTGSTGTAGTIGRSPGIRKNDVDYGRRASQFIFEHINDIKKSGLGIGDRCYVWFYSKASFLSKKWFTHCFLIIVMTLYTVGGALVFFTIEGQNEKKLIENDIKLQIEELLKELRIKSLTLPLKYSEKEWKGEAARKIANFEKRITKAFDQHALVVSNTQKIGDEKFEPVWTLFNAIVYCSTLYTTIGYGHLYPTTFTGRVFTIAYSIIGIPLFLIALTDFGKLFTRSIKFVWSYVRRLYYTGNCRKVRKTSHVKEILKGAQTMYQIATFRRFSMAPQKNPFDFEAGSPGSPGSPSSHITGSEPVTPAPSAFEIDDEFNLPISLALFILIAYMLLGTWVFMIWEDWQFFESFYFIFVSMSTIGFGDVVPLNPLYMIISIFYLCFGLALMTMCITVVQDKLSDTFKEASTKLRNTMGLEVQSDGSVVTLSPQAVEVASIHSTGKDEDDGKEEGPILVLDDDDDDNRLVQEEPKIVKEVPS